MTKLTLGEAHRLRYHCNRACTLCELSVGADIEALVKPSCSKL